MKIFAITATAFLATVALAAPALVEARDPVWVDVDFIGPDGAHFVKDFSVGSLLDIVFPHKISRIHAIPDDYAGEFTTLDGSVITVAGPDTIDLGTPQFLTSVNFTEIAIKPEW